MASTTATIDQAEAPIIALASNPAFFSANAATQLSMADNACSAWKQDMMGKLAACGYSEEEAANIWAMMMNFIVWIVNNFFNLLKRIGDLIRDKFKELIGECECEDWAWGEVVPEGPI